MRLFAIPALLATLTLGGCNTPVDPATIKSVQDATTQACAFVPTAITIANIFAGSNAIVGNVSAIAKMICDAVTAHPAAARRGAFIPVVNGVKIQGHFVNRQAR